jgi:ubiquinone/menaquinone biosynthesis C-methylase UbiE
MLIHYLLFIFMMISFLIIFAKPTPVSSSTPHSIVPYSEEYLPFYEMITYKPLRYQEELAFLKTKMSTSSQVLDVGSGLGYHVNALNESNIHAVGLDSSKAMVKYAQQKYPCTFVHGNVLSTSLFPEHSFTHILCLYYTIYCILDKKTFLSNVHHWLSEDGILFIHGANQWKYGETMSGEITYDSSLQQSILKEKITYQNKNHVIHHIMYRISKEELIELASQCHFTWIDEYVYSNQYILVFQRKTPMYDNISFC